MLKKYGFLLMLAQASVQAAEGELPEGQHYDPGIELPDGEGRELLATACTRCHDLRGLPAYRNYWRAPQWRAMVETMVKNGAKLEPAQMEVVTGYLAEHFGPKD